MIIAVYREGWTTTDEDNRFTIHWDEPETKEFETEEDYWEWNSERTMDEATDPGRRSDGEQKYRFEIFFAGEVSRRMTLEGQEG